MKNNTNGNALKIKFYDNVKVYVNGQHFENAFITENGSAARKCDTIYVRKAKNLLTADGPFANEFETITNIINNVENAFSTFGEESIDIRIPCKILTNWIAKGIIVKPDFQRNGGVKTNTEKSDIIGSLISGDTESLGHIILVLKPNKDGFSVDIFEIEDGHQRTSTFMEFLCDITLRERLTGQTDLTDFHLSGTGTLLDNMSYNDLVKHCPEIRTNIDNTMIKVTILHPSRHPDAHNLFNTMNGKQTRVSKEEMINADFCKDAMFAGVKSLCNREDISTMANRLFGGTKDDLRFVTTSNLIAAVALSDYAFTNNRELVNFKVKNTAGAIAKSYLPTLVDKCEKLEKVNMARRVLNRMKKNDVPLNFCNRFNINKDTGDAIIRPTSGHKGYPKNHCPYYRTQNKSLAQSLLLFATYRYMVENKYTDNEMINALVAIEDFFINKMESNHQSAGNTFSTYIDELITCVKVYLKKA